MIIINLKGGLGNQMFQYAMGLRWAMHHNTELKLDVGFINNRNTKGKYVLRDYGLNIFCLNHSYATEEEIFLLKQRSKNKYLNKLLNRFLGYKPSYLLEKFNTEKIDYVENDTYLDGYFQSEINFLPIKLELLKAFSFKTPLEASHLLVYDKISNVNSVCVHIRRGDFVNNAHHPICSLAYYEKALKFITSNVKNIELFVFSDDINWCKENMHLGYNTQFIDDQTINSNLSATLQLMRNCKHFVIANSTLSWWAAYLSIGIEKIVVAPKIWTNTNNSYVENLIPKSWIKL